jgi:hypothetical protein
MMLFSWQIAGQQGIRRQSQAAALWPGVDGADRGRVRGAGRFGGALGQSQHHSLLVAGGWWLVAGGWWLVAGGRWQLAREGAHQVATLPVSASSVCIREIDATTDPVPGFSTVQQSAPKFFGDGSRLLILR